MAFVKLIKTNAYFKRFQTKFKRRREGKTDYYSRKRLIIQPRDKYNSPKYRLVGRITCGKIIGQIIYATIKGDKVLCQANSAELKQYGLTAGLTNYSACYATGLLLGRRLLKQLEMDTMYKGNDKIDGEKYDVNENPEERRPFKAVLDTGLYRTSTGARIFGVLKGAVDAGLYVPHSVKRFPGYHRAEEEGDTSEYVASEHRDRIFGKHVDTYMAELKGESQDEYKKQFSKWDACLKKNGVPTVEALMTKIFDAIKKNPGFTKKEAPKNPKRDHKKFRTARIGRDQRRQRAAQKIQLKLKSQQ